MAVWNVFAIFIIKPFRTEFFLNKKQKIIKYP